jgi:hypothetical protein
LKRSGTDEPKWAEIHMCMETLEVSLDSYLYLKLAKHYVFLIISCFLFNKIREQEDGTGSARKQGGEREVGQIMHTDVSKCKNDKIKKKAQYVKNRENCK